MVNHAQDNPAAPRDRALVAAAPCSFGVLERGDGVGSAHALLEVVAGGGYAGLDLGPAGFLGCGSDLAHNLGRVGLVLAGGWAQLDDTDPDQTGLDAVLDAFDAAGNGGDRTPSRPTLAADEPADAVAGRPPQLDAAGWTRLVERVTRAAETCRTRGYEPVFHPHVGTWVSTPDDTDRLLEAVDVDLCLDTGHLVLGGGDPLAALRAWRERITHVHLKDVGVDAARALAERGAPMREVWASGVFRELGGGDLDLDAVLAGLDGFDGWIVVEQDRLVTDRHGWATSADAQRRNRAWLRERGW
ncbi:sugar phosphate isomerase/epimerase [soil metagenome]